MTDLAPAAFPARNPVMRNPQPAAAALTLGHDGAQLYRGALTAHLGALIAAADDLPQGPAGIRINGLAALRPLLVPTGPIGSIAAGVLGPTSRAVRAVLFNKTPGTNWSLG